MIERDKDVARQSGFTLLEVMVVMLLLAVAATMTWGPIAARVRTASLRRFQAELAEYDAAQRAATRSVGMRAGNTNEVLIGSTHSYIELVSGRGAPAELSYDADQNCFLYSETARILSPPSGVQLTAFRRWHPVLCRWIDVDAIGYNRSGQSQTYALRVETASGRPSWLVVLGTSGRTTVVAGSSLPQWKPQ